MFTSLRYLRVKLLKYKGNNKECDVLQIGVCIGFSLKGFNFLYDGALTFQMVFIACRIVTLRNSQ